MQIHIQPLVADLKFPSYAHPGDVGLDLYARESAVIQPGERKLFMLGFALEFPEGYVALVKDKSSVSWGLGLHCIGGVFDAGYRGEYNVGLVNIGKDSATIKEGQKIAQLVIQPIIHANLVVSETLSDTSRGTGSFGSTGEYYI